MKLNGIFSYFPSIKMPNQLLNECNKVLLLTPDGPLSPITDAYSMNEENMLDYKGDMIEKKDLLRVLI